MQRCPSRHSQQFGLLPSESHERHRFSVPLQLSGQRLRKRSKGGAKCSRGFRRACAASARAGVFFVRQKRRLQSVPLYMTAWAFPKRLPWTRHLAPLTLSCYLRAASAHPLLPRTPVSPPPQLRQPPIVGQFRPLLRSFKLDAHVTLKFRPRGLEGCCARPADRPIPRGARCAEVPDRPPATQTPASQKEPAANARVPEQCERRIKKSTPRKL